MARGKKHAPEQIVSLLRQIEFAVANGKTTPVGCRDNGITEQTYYTPENDSNEILTP
jgi:putative transposase